MTIKKVLLLLMMMVAAYLPLRAQLSAENYSILQEKEKQLQPIAANIVGGREEADRLEAVKQFIPRLVQALKLNYSYYYPFDSLQQVSILYPPDSTFRIFTLGLNKTAGEYHYFGTIQMNTKDGSLKLFPLFDNSAFTKNVIDTVTNNKGWIGCIYYKLIEKTAAGKKYYTLLGWDSNNFMSNKKIADVLHFDKNAPVFGAPVFSFAKDTISKPVQDRFVMEYKNDGQARMNYDDEMKMIIYDHLIPLDGDKTKKYNYVPDGSYEGFIWKNGKWLHQEKIFTQKLKDGQAPVPQPFDFKKERTDTLQ